MVELIVGTYGVLCWLLFAKFKVIPINTYTIVTAFLGGGVILLLLYIFLSVFHPVAHDGRMYAPVVQIVPNVRGLVIEVPIEANQPIKKGDVLFRIDPKPFQIDVDRLRASLESKNVTFAQLEQQVAAAEAATKQARADLELSESQLDRQAREAHEQAVAKVDQVKKKRDLSKSQYERVAVLGKSLAVAQEEVDRIQTKYLTDEEELRQATAEEKIAAEKLKSGSAGMESARQGVAAAEANERKLRVQLNAELDGVNPQVREVQAELEK